MSMMRVIKRIIVRNGVACGAHIFAKLKFANNIFSPICQLLMPAKITGYTVDMGTPIPIYTVDMGPLPI